jgi:hypothetical protein
MLSRARLLTRRRGPPSHAARVGTRADHAGVAAAPRGEIPYPVRVRNNVAPCGNVVVGSCDAVHRAAARTPRPMETTKKLFRKKCREAATFSKDLTI